MNDRMEGHGDHGRFLPTHTFSSRARKRERERFHVVSDESGATNEIRTTAIFFLVSLSNYQNLNESGVLRVWSEPIESNGCLFFPVSQSNYQNPNESGVIRVWSEPIESNEQVRCDLSLVRSNRVEQSDSIESGPIQ